MKAAAVDNPKNVIEDGLSTDRLKLYKISTNEEAELRECLITLGSGRLLQGDDLVRKVFDDVRLTLALRIVVEFVLGVLSSCTLYFFLASHIHVEYWERKRKPDEEEIRQLSFSDLKTCNTIRYQFYRMVTYKLELIYSWRLVVPTI